MEEITGREKAVPCQHCYAMIFQPTGTQGELVWIGNDGTYSRMCEPGVTSVTHAPMPVITVS